MSYYSVWVWRRVTYQKCEFDPKGSEISILEDITEMAQFQLYDQDEYLKVAIF